MRRSKQARSQRAIQEHSVQIETQDDGGYIVVNSRNEAAELAHHQTRQAATSSNNKTPLQFTHTGGAYIRQSFWWSANVPAPSAKLQITAQAITLTSWSKQYSFPKAQIQAIYIYFGFFSTGLQIEHSMPQHPKFIVFWPLRLDEVKASLKQMGYKVN